MKVKGFVLQEKPRIYVVSISGKWLLKRSTPTWRIDDPHKGFQRVVKEERARQIALAVLDQQRTFPNAIVLATNIKSFKGEGVNLNINDNIKFLVVDGQHRLYAQEFSNFDAEYACLVHVGLTEVEMARLFLEINDNQKRVPSSLRWDLVRLVRPNDDPIAIGAAEMVYSLASDEESPLFQRIDLTGEQSEIILKQGSVAPSLRGILGPKSSLSKFSYDEQYNVVIQFFIALKERDKNWGKNNSNFYKARVIRALLRLLPELFIKTNKNPYDLYFSEFLPYLKKIKESSLDSEKIKSVQGSAGIKAIYDTIKEQVFS